MAYLDFMFEGSVATIAINAECLRFILGTLTLQKKLPKSQKRAKDKQYFDLVQNAPSKCANF